MLYCYKHWCPQIFSSINDNSTAYQHGYSNSEPNSGRTVFGNLSSFMARNLRLSAKMSFKNAILMGATMQRLPIPGGWIFLPQLRHWCLILWDTALMVSSYPSCAWDWFLSNTLVSVGAGGQCVWCCGHVNVSPDHPVLVTGHPPYRRPNIPSLHTCSFHKVPANISRFFV